MSLVDIVLVLVIAGLVMWLINTYIPMAAGIKSLLNIVVFVVVAVWVLQGFGIVGNISRVHIPSLR
jgi:Na+-translocating ferredoxin:NAD+ oxidoreductase RnfA subunit